MATGEKITIDDLQKLVLEFSEMRKQKEALEELAAKIENQLKGMKGKITQVMMEHGQTSFRVDNVGLVTVVAHERVPTPKTSEENKALYEYVMQKYGEETCLSKFKMHDKTLTSFFKEERAMLPKEDQELFRLPGVGEPSVHHDISFKKS